MTTWKRARTARAARASGSPARSRYLARRLRTVWLLRLLLARLLRGVCRAQAKERAIRANRGASRPQNGRPDSGRSAALSFLSSPRQGHWEDLEGDEVLVEEDEDGDSIDLSSEDSARERRELEEALLAEQARRDPLTGGFEIDPARPRVLSEFEPSYEGGARQQDLDVVDRVTDVALRSRGMTGGAVCLLNGCKYEGEWRGGIPHGRGTLCWDDGTTYTGDINKGEITGEGSYFYPSGVEYHGQVGLGVRQGEEHCVLHRHTHTHTHTQTHRW